MAEWWGDDEDQRESELQGADRRAHEKHLCEREKPHGVQRGPKRARQRSNRARQRSKGSQLLSREVLCFQRGF